MSYPESQSDMPTRTVGFTTGKLSQFFKDGGVADYENARTIINGHDKAANIADIARRFSEVLLASAA
jgi:hypothetical protein